MRRTFSVRLDRSFGGNSPLFLVATAIIRASSICRLSVAKVPSVLSSMFGMVSKGAFSRISRDSSRAGVEIGGGGA